MKRIVIAAFAAVVGLGLFAHDAEAKRLGGGKSAGMSRDSSITQRQAVPAKPAAPTAAPAPAPAPAAKPASGMSRWLGPIAGLAAGLGIAALLSHFGMGEAMSNFLMIALLAFAVIFVVRLLFRRAAPAPQPMPAGGPAYAEPMRFEASPAAGAASSAAPAGVPADFDVEGFVRQAKLNFIRLQAANDRGDMDDIREFTTPEFFAEVKMQFDERGRGAQQTDVMVLNADLLDVSTEGSRYIASVRFHGQLREEANAAPENFREVWHLVKPVDGSRGWTLAGIQQD